MHTKTFLLIVLTLVLAACGGQATPTPEPPTAAPPQLTQAEPTTEPAPPAESSESMANYFKIVPGESQLQYEVGEVFINQNNRFNVAVGVTRQVSGEINIDRDAPQNSNYGTFTADISQFTSDSNRRDNALRERFIESARFPEVSFNITQVEGMPETYQEGQEVALQISGDLTIREVTQPVTFGAVVKLEGDTLTGEATTTILMSDFGFGPIDIGGIIKTEDEVKVTLNFVAKP